MIKLTTGTYTKSWIKWQPKNKGGWFKIIGTHYHRNLLGTYKPLHTIKGEWDWKYYARRESAMFIL